MNDNSATLNIIIAGYVFGFPNGNGASARISQYARGLAAHGCNVNILCLKPTELPDGSGLNRAAKGEYNGVSFEYTSRTSIYSKVAIIRYLQNIIGVIGAFRTVHQLRKNRKIHVILYYGTDSLFYTISLWLLARLHGACFVGENTEAPFVYSNSKFSTSFKKWLVTRFAHKLFDGFVVISTYLEKLFGESLRKNAPVLRLPVLVDTSLFKSPGPAVFSSTKYIIYCGNLSHEGEIDTLLDAWSRMKFEFPEWKLRIIGDNSSPAIHDPILSRVNELDIEEYVEFTGLVPRDQLIELLLSGDVMVLPRSSGLFSEAGLPNKLGEYLATGKPVITTNIGDINLYLRDCVDVFLVQPDDIRAFVDKMRYVLNHPNEAGRVGGNGLLAAQQYFDTITNCKRLIDFIQNLN